MTATRNKSSVKKPKNKEKSIISDVQSRSVNKTTRRKKSEKSGSNSEIEVLTDVLSGETEAAAMKDAGLSAPQKNSLVPALKPADLSIHDQNLLGLYLKEIAKTALLKPEEERALATLVFEKQDRLALQKLVQANLRFVVKIAFEYVRYGAKILDLIQEGNVGLIKAVQDFNPYKEVRLTTYAVWWIRSYIQDFLLRNWSLVRIGTTAAQKKLFYRLKKEQEKFEREGIRPEPKAIAMELNVDEEDVKLMDERLKGGDVSLYSVARDSDEDSPLGIIQKISTGETLADEALDFQEQAMLFKKALEEFQKLLEPRDREIFEARLLSENPKTLLEIGEHYGFSKERARQIEERLKGKLKEFLTEKYPDISVRS